MKDDLAYFYPMIEMVGLIEEPRLLPGGNAAGIMWASGLGSTPITPSTSTQAAPAPRVDCSMQAIATSAWSEVLKNHLTERCYEC
jgi:hypothetical protein